MANALCFPNPGHVRGADERSLRTGPSGKEDLLPDISVPWSRKEAILVSARPGPRMPA